MAAEFEFFDPDEDFAVSQGSLPHWEQAGKTYFITFRTADSLPDSVWRRWLLQRRDWLARHHIDPDDEDWADRLAKLDERFQRQFHETISREFQSRLDAGHGACPLSRGELAGIVAESLWHFDGDRYRMDDFIVMPNHVHVLAQFLGGTKLKAQCYSWKKFAATKINRTLKQTGTFWQKESFDHLVRGPEQLERLRRYIADNPRKAGLKEGEYFYYQRSAGRPVGPARSRGTP